MRNDRENHKRGSSISKAASPNLENTVSSKQTGWSLWTTPPVGQLGQWPWVLGRLMRLGLPWSEWGWEGKYQPGHSLLVQWRREQGVEPGSSGRVGKWRVRALALEVEGREYSKPSWAISDQYLPILSSNISHTFQLEEKQRYELRKRRILPSI